jgi:hypothetical protein
MPPTDDTRLAVGPRPVPERWLLQMRWSVRGGFSRLAAARRTVVVTYPYPYGRQTRVFRSGGLSSKTVV